MHIGIANPTLRETVDRWRVEPSSTTPKTIKADIVGKNIDAGDNQRVNVLLEETDGVDQVVIADWQGRSAV